MARVTTSLRFPAKLFGRARRAAKSQGVTTNAFVVGALAREVARYERAHRDELTTRIATTIRKTVVEGV